MSYPINYPTPQGANVQIFTPNTNTSSREFSNTWVKPQGASMVWFTLIGPGGRGGTTSTDANGSSATGGGGGSGAVTNCMMPAFLIPDTLVIEVYASLSALTYATEIYYQNKTGGAYSLLLAENGDSAPSVNTTTTAIVGAGGAGGAASASNEFSAAGFFQSVAGQDGTAGNISQTTSTTTFLQGGVGGASSADQVVSQYGYGRAAYNVQAQPGYGVLSPIFVSVASTRANNAFAGSADSLANRNGFGSGGGGSFTTAVNDQRWGTPGGDGLVVIITW
jgi:hypothetical protein